MGFFTAVFIFICAIAFLSLFVKYPPLFAIFIVTVTLVIFVSYQSSRDKEEATKRGVERIRQELEKVSFNVSKEIYLTRESAPHGLVYSELIIDSQNKQIAICDFLKDDLKLIPFQQLINCEIIENDETVRSFAGVLKKNSKLEIAGMHTREIKPIINNLSIKVETLSPDNSVILIPIITRQVDRKAYDYKKAKDIANNAYSVLIKIIRESRLALHQNN